MIPFVQVPADLAAEIADLRRQLASVEAVALELIAERDRAVAELGRLQQLSLHEGDHADSRGDPISAAQRLQQLSLTEAQA